MKAGWIAQRRKNPAGSGIKDRLGREICHGDVVRFINKRQWYGPMKSDKELDGLPFEERRIELPKDYGWLLWQEIQTYWQVIKHRGRNV